MKVGKETVAGVIAPPECRAHRDGGGVHKTERAALQLWSDALAGLPATQARIIPGAHDNPLDRLEIHVGAKSGRRAEGLAKILAANDPPIIVRGQAASRGHFHLDPCNPRDGEAEIVANTLDAVLCGQAR